MKKQFVKPTASFLQKYEYQPGTKMIQRAGRHKQLIKTKGGDTYIKEHGSLAGTLRTKQIQSNNWKSPFYRLKSA